MMPELVEFEYTNHRGEAATRRVRPLRFFFGESEWHPGPQWLMEALDFSGDRGGVHRTFALKDVRSWRPAT